MASMALLSRKRSLDRDHILGQAARAARRRGQRHRRKALGLYRQVLEAEPDNPDLLRKIALLLVKTQDPNNACASYRRAIAVFSDRGFFDRAVGVCREALRYLPRAVPLWKDLAALEVERGRRVDAVEALLKGRRRFRGRRSRAEARELLVAAHHIDPINLAVTFDLASQLARSDDRPRALALLDGLAAARPSDGRRIRAKQFRISPGVRTAWCWFRSLFHAA
jgi:tetratricopeptide (TPR) repeat protein